MNSQKKSQSKPSSIGPIAWLALIIILAVCFAWPFAPFLVGAALALLPDNYRSYRNNQHEVLRDGRSVDLIFKGNDTTDGSFLVQTSQKKGLLSVPLKSRALPLAAEPDLRILANGKTVIFVKNNSGKEPLPIGLDEFLEGVEKVPDYK